MTKKEKERAMEFAPYMENVPENGAVKIESLYAFKDISVLYARCDKCRWHYEQGRDIACAISKDVVRSDDYCSYWERKYE